MSIPAAALQDLKDEASTRFIGHGAVVGIGLSGNHGLVVMTSRPDPEGEAAIRSWARSRSVAVDVLMTGPFLAAASG